MPLPPRRDDIWVFGYGSLMWRPGFDYEEWRPARVHGYHRALCVWSIHHRGMPERPGLVMGLDRGGTCRGRAYRVARRNWPQVLAYLNRRELLTDVYEPRFVCATFDDGTRVRTFVYVANRHHSQYAGRLPDTKVVGVVKGAEGASGSDLEYLRNSVAHLDELGIPDGPLHAVLRLIEQEAG